MRPSMSSLRTKAWLLSLLLLAMTARAAAAPPVVLLWPDGAPGSEGKTDPEKVVSAPMMPIQVTSVHKPSLTVYLPKKETAAGAAVIVIPGGGHRMLAMEHEGYAVGRWLSERGIAAFILKYRLAREEGSTYEVETHALADTQRAIRLVRQEAKEWDVDPARVGVLGFSAGGELAALASVPSTSETGHFAIHFERPEQLAWRLVEPAALCDGLRPRARRSRSGSETPRWASTVS